MKPEDQSPLPPPENGSAEAAAAGADAPGGSSAEQRLAELEAKHASVSDAYLRAKAEAENTRRRAEEEMSKARKFAVEGFAESLLPVCDSLEAAIAQQHSDKPATPEQMLEGHLFLVRCLRAYFRLQHGRLPAIDIRLYRYIQFWPVRSTNYPSQSRWFPSRIPKAACFPGHRKSELSVA